MKWSNHPRDMYQGWKIAYYWVGDSSMNVWHADRYGVQMSAQTKDQLFRMIDTRNYEAKEKNK